MHELINLLPSGPKWTYEEIEFPGYPTRQPIVVYYRDGLECLEELFADPKFVDQMDFRPRKEFADSECKNRVFGEYMTADRAWNIQVTILLITHWPLYSFCCAGEIARWGNAIGGHAFLG